MKHLLASAAMGLVLGTAAYAEQHEMGTGGYEIGENDFYATNMIGMRVYSSEQELGENGDAIDFEAQQWDDVGEINDMIVSEDGTVQAVIVGVGGFLGIGEKDVAITMDQIRTYDDANGERFLVINSSQAALEGAPAFERANETAMAAEPGMVEQTEEAGEAMAEGEAVEGVPADGDTAMTEVETAEGEMAEAEAEVETEMAEMETEAETEMAEAEAAVEEGAAEAEAAVETEMAEAETELETEMAEAEGEVADAAAEVEGEMAEAEAAVEGEMAEGEAAIEGEMAEGEAEMAEGEMATGGVQLEGYAAATLDDISVEQLSGASVYGAQDENIGEIEDLVVTDTGEVEQAVIGVGGFLGLGEKKVAVNFDDLQLMTNEDGSDIRVYISATEDELKALPEYEAPEAEMPAAEAGAEAEMEMEAEEAPAAQ
ncbi:PRC-barrel domain-containing protein [Limimaricola pyoseonensis]|uniref:PRC-barrel domain-containing protein n=1 Tax=Limimaricola pyoseonensis TaxID=521013 RepID=A0A1G7C3Y8_9RHOB|nr:PRC-barrel domain-containing protein [Limimaricola pyoseonensis]SDE34028.1 PRC-barrel domain-containing protein [Limimaricola pyoseonensis]